VFVPANVYASITRRAFYPESEYFELTLDDVAVPATVSHGIIIIDDKKRSRFRARMRSPVTFGNCARCSAVQAVCAFDLKTFFVPEFSA